MRQSSSGQTRYSSRWVEQRLRLGKWSSVKLMFCIYFRCMLWMSLALPPGLCPATLRNPDSIRITDANHHPSQWIHCSYRCCSLCSDCYCWWVQFHFPALAYTRLTLSSRSSWHSHPSTPTGVWIDAGSRAESNATEGVAHFLEHMAFKVR